MQRWSVVLRRSPLRLSTAHCFLSRQSGKLWSVRAASVSAPSGALGDNSSSMATIRQGQSKESRVRGSGTISRSLQTVSLMDLLNDIPIPEMSEYLYYDQVEKLPENVAKLQPFEDSLSRYAADRGISPLDARCLSKIKDNLRRGGHPDFPRRCDPKNIGMQGSSVATGKDDLDRYWSSLDGESFRWIQRQRLLHRANSIDPWIAWKLLEMGVSLEWTRHPLMDRHFRWIGQDQSRSLMSMLRSADSTQPSSNNALLNAESDPLFPFVERKQNFGTDNDALRMLNPFYEVWFEMMPPVLKQLRMMGRRADPSITRITDGDKNITTRIQQSSDPESNEEETNDEPEMEQLNDEPSNPELKSTEQWWENEELSRRFQRQRYDWESKEWIFEFGKNRKFRSAEDARRFAQWAYQNQTKAVNESLKEGMEIPMTKHDLSKFKKENRSEWKLPMRSDGVTFASYSARVNDDGISKGRESNVHKNTLVTKGDDQSDHHDGSMELCSGKRYLSKLYIKALKNDLIKPEYLSYHELKNVLLELGLKLTEKEYKNDRRKQEFFRSLQKPVLTSVPRAPFANDHAGIFDLIQTEVKVGKHPFQPNWNLWNIQTQPNLDESKLAEKVRGWLENWKGTSDEYQKILAKKQGKYQKTLLHRSEVRSRITNGIRLLREEIDEKEQILIGMYADLQRLDRMQKSGVSEQSSNDGNGYQKRMKVLSGSDVRSGVDDFQFSKLSDEYVTVLKSYNEYKEKVIQMHQLLDHYTTLYNL